MKKKLFVIFSFFCLLCLSCNDEDQIADPPLEEIILTAIVIDPDSSIALIGSNIQFEAIAKDQKNNIIDNLIFKWISSDTSVVSINSTGVAFCESIGSVNITAEYDTITSNKAFLSVLQNDTIISEIIITPDSLIGIIGSYIQFEALAKDQYGQTIENLNFKWISSDISIVSVDSSGLAFLKSEGEVTITAVYDTLTSNVAIFTVISPTIKAGQKTGKGIVYTDLYPGLQIGYFNWNSVNIDLNKDGVDDFVISHRHDGGNNREIIVFIEPIGGNEINFNPSYSDIADSILYNTVDTSYSGLKLYNPALFEEWADTVAQNSLIDSNLLWISNTTTLFFHYARDAIAWGYDFGMWERGKSKYLAVRLFTTNGFTSGWMHVKIEVLVAESLLLEYAGIRIDD